MLHDTRDQDICAVAYRINLNLFTHQVFIDQNRVILCDLVDGIDKFYDLIIIECNVHALSAKYIGRTNQYRITDAICCCFCFLSGVYGITCCSRNTCLLQNLIKELTVLSCINVFCFCTKDRHAHLHQALCQFDGCLSTELYNCSIRFFDVYDVLYIFRCQRLEIQFVSNIKVSGNCLWVVVDNDCLISGFCEGPCTMYGAEVELDTLSDTDRTGTKYQNFFLLCCSVCFVFTIKAGIVIWCCCLKLCGTGINHLEGSCDAVFVTHVFDVFFIFSG